MTTLERMWVRARPFIAEALEHARGTHELADLVKATMDGHVQLWVGERSAAITEILNFPRKRGLNLFLVGGDLDEIRAAQPGIEAFARGHGCDFIMFSGRLSRAGRARSGWERSLPDFSPDWIAMHKELR